MRKIIRNSLIILAGSILAGYILLVMVYCIPQRFLIKNLADSVPVIQRDDLNEVIFGYPSSTLDVFTDGAMLNIALHTIAENPFRRAIACYQYIYNDRSPAEGFMDYFIPKEPDGDLLYFRYWHGFLVVLKPLLLFFNYSDIRIINFIGQLGLMAATLYAFAKRKLYGYIAPVLITYLFLMPVTLPLSLQYSWVFYTGMGSLAALVAFYDRLKKKEWIPYLFLITGILTSYLDLMTYPVFTLGLPITGLLVLGDETDIAKKYKDFIISGISWFAGYALMWAGKILISMPFYGTDVWADTFGSVSKRSASGAAEEGVGYTDALTVVFAMYKNRIFKITLIVFTIAVIVWLIYQIFRKRARINVKELPMFLAVIAIPFVWYFVTIEHTHLHAFFTYKSLTVAVFAYCACLIKLRGSKE